MESAQIGALINQWWMDYVLINVMEKFKEDRSVGDRDLIQSVLKANVNSTDDMTRKKMHLLFLLCRLADGENYSETYENSEKTELTCMEEGIDVFQDIVGDSYEEAASCLSSLKEQSVYVCCRRMNYGIAMQVFNRQWSEPKTADEMKLKKVIHKVIISKDPNHHLLEEHSYEVMCSSVMGILEKIIGSFGEPFLIKVAIEVLQNQRKVEAGRQNFNVNLSGPLLKSLRDHFKQRLEEFTAENDEETQEICNVKRKKKDKYTKRIEKVKQRHLLGDLTNRTNADLGNEEAGCNLDFLSLSKTSTPRKRQETSETSNEQMAPRTSKTSRYEEDNISTGNSFDKSLRKRVKGSSAMKKSTTTTTTAAGKEYGNGRQMRLNLLGLKADDTHSVSNMSRFSSHSKCFWSMTETENFYKAVQMFGVGRWAEIRDIGFQSRSNVNLKDKWRNITSKPKVLEALEKKFGTVRRKTRY